MATGYHWKHIADIGHDAETLTDGELRSLHRVWRAQRKELERTGEYDAFDQRLRREWSIETGILEDVYTLDRGVTRTLIQKGIDAERIGRDATNQDPVFVAQVIRDHYDALEMLFDFVGGQRELTAGYVKELHAALLRSVDTYKAVDQFGQVFERRLEKGKYKETSNSPTRADGMVHEYCPPEHVASEMDDLLRMYAAHGTTVPPEVEAAWLHHRFTQIHPFPDGNGRVARALASLVFLKAGWFPLVIRRDLREQYIDALEQADAGDLRSLVARFVESQRTSLIEASEVIYDLKPAANAHDAILAARDRLVQRGAAPMPEWLQAVATSRTLFEVAQRSLGSVATDLANQIGGLRPEFKFQTGTMASHAPYPIREEIMRSLGLAGDSKFSEGIVLTLETGQKDFLTIAFQAIGPKFRGLVAVLGYLSRDGIPPLNVGNGFFQINYDEDVETARTRFAVWLDRTIVNGLDEWRKRL